MNQQVVATRESEDFVRRIEQTALRRLNGRMRDLKLMARDDGLILQGHARTYYIKQLAQHAVMDLTKLRIRANEIEVAQVPKDSSCRRAALSLFCDRQITSP